MKDTLRIVERFVSIQGEGSLVGVPSSFVRISGCNLRCVWCDTPNSSWQPEGVRETVGDLIAWCGQGPRHVVVTGGEPLLFAATAELCHGLRKAGHHVTVETAGTVWCEGIVADLMSVSPKLRHSTPRGRAGRLHEQGRYNREVLRRLVCSFDYQLKFCVRTDSAQALSDDLHEIEDTLAALDVKNRTRVFLVPEGTDAERLREGYRRLVDVCRTTGMRLGLRLHIDLFGHTPGT